MAFAGGVLQFLNKSHLDEVLEALKKCQYSDTSYYQLGRSLGLSIRTLDTIEAEHKGNDGRCLLEVFKKWLNQADDVESKGGPSYYTLIAALRAIGANAVADGIDREKQLQPACVILVNHLDQLSQSLRDDLLPSLVQFLHKEGVLNEINASGNKENLPVLMAVQEAVCTDYKNLKKFATVLRQFSVTISVSEAILQDYKKEFHDVNTNKDVTAGETKNQNDDSYKPKNIGGLLLSVGVHVVINSDVDSTSSGPYESVVMDCKSLKELISSPSTTVMVQPFLFSLSGLPKSGKTAAFNTFMRYHIQGNPFLLPDMKIRPPAFDDLVHYDLIAVPDAMSPSRLLITEATREFSCVFGLFSAFKQLLSKEERVPLLDPKNASLQNVFQEPELNEHLQYMYRYIGASFSDLGDESKLASYAEKLKVIYPEKNALVNIWDIPSNSAIHDVLSALQGHFSNNHLALLLDLERDLDKLHEPPKVDGGDGDLKLMKWRPRIHYLLRTCRMSESFEEKENRSEVCTVFATHDDSCTSEELERKIDKLREKVKSAAGDIGVSKLLDYNIETVSRKGFQILHQKIKKMIFKAPSEVVPIAWLFLRSMFHLSSKVFRHKDELKALAVECGMDESSLKRFGKFYTSFGSIFDVSLVNPDAQYVIVKPILFLKKVNELFSSKSAVFPTIEYGIVPERVGFKIFGEDWPAYKDSLICLNLATKIASDSIEMPPNVPLNDPNDAYYFISLCRRNGSSIRETDPNSVHLITGISTPSGVFNQVKFVRLLLNSQPQRKLVACENPNQTIINDTSSGTTVTWVDFGPTTQLHLSKPNHELCYAVVQAYREMAVNSHVDVKYEFVKFCVTGNTNNPCDLVSAPFHPLPVDKPICEQCQVARPKRLNDALTKVWNEALKGKSSTKTEKKEMTSSPEASQQCRLNEKKQMTSLPEASLQIKSRLNEEPAHVVLMNCLSSIANQWKELGIALHLKTNDLESAKSEASDKLRLSCVLQRWRDNKFPSYTWITILDIISGPIIDNIRLRNEIEQSLITEQGIGESSSHAAVPPTQSNDVDPSTGALETTGGIEEVDTHRAQQESMSQRSSSLTATATASLESESIREQNKELLRDYSVDQICDLLDKIGAGQYKEKFKKMGINGHSFFSLTEDDLLDVEQFNMTNKFHRKIVMEIVNGATLVANQ